MREGAKKIIIAAGGSGGHIFPAIALARRLKTIDSRIDIKFIGSRKALDRRIFEKEGASFSLLSDNSLTRVFSPAAIPSFFRFLADFARAFAALRRYRPDVAVGFGGYVSFPVILSAFFLGVPRISHEQNVVPGRSNAVLFEISDRIALSFRETGKFLGRHAPKSTVTGNPIRSGDFNDNRMFGIRRFGLDAEKFTLLVIGGSQGAHFLNRTFVSALRKLDAGVLSAIQVIHITGVKDYEWALGAYDGLGIEYRVHSFIDRIEEAYSASDLVVTRSGASAIFEIAFFARPMILIPYPFAKGHQAANARAFADKGAALVMEEDGLTPAAFRDKIAYLLGNRGELKRLSECARALASPDASGYLAEEVLSLVKIRRHGKIRR